MQQYCSDSHTQTNKWDSGQSSNTQKTNGQELEVCKEKRLLSERALQLKSSKKFHLSFLCFWERYTTRSDDRSTHFTQPKAQFKVLYCCWCWVYFLQLTFTSYFCFLLTRSCNVKKLTSFIMRFFIFVVVDDSIETQNVLLYVSY